MSPTPLFRPLAAACAWLLVTCIAGADVRVSLTASADPAYTERKYASGAIRTETYVVMQGRYFEGQTVDRSIERMSFRSVAERFMPELAKQKYLPAASLKEADLVIVVHWGTTLPTLVTHELMAQSSEFTGTNSNGATMMNDALGSAAEASLSPVIELGDTSRNEAHLERLEQVASDAGVGMNRTDNIALLGYADELFRLRKRLWSSGEEQSLRHDLKTERYFVILQAYDLKSGTAASRRPIWTMNINMSSPGNNFQGALGRMSAAAVSYVGRTTDTVRSVRSDVREGRVELAPLQILNETK